MKKLIKYVSIFIGSLLLLIGLLLLYTQTNHFRSLVKSKATEFSNEHLNGELIISELKGNFYNTLCLKDIRLIEGDSTLIQIDSIYLRYHLRNIFKKKITVETALVQSPQFNIWQQDSIWHISYVLEELIEFIISSPSNFPLIIKANKIMLRGGNGYIMPSAPDSITTFSDTNISADGSFKLGEIFLNVDKFNIKTTNPDFEINELEAELRKIETETTIKNLTLKTKKMNIEANGVYESLQNFNIKANVKSFNIDELKDFVPPLPLTLKIIPEITFEVNSDNDELKCMALMKKQNKSVELNANIYSFFKALNSNTKTSGFNGSLTFYNFIPEEWLEIEQTKVSLNGTVFATGANIFNYKDDISVKGSFNNSAYKGIIANIINFNAEQKNKSVNANFLVKYNGSESHCNLSVENLYNNPNYTVDVVTNNLNISELYPDLVNTTINGHLYISGSQLITQDRKAKASARFSNSLVYNYAIDSVVAESNINGDIITLDTMLIYANDNIIFNNGKFNIADYSFNAESGIISKSHDFLSSFELPEFVYEEASGTILSSGNIDSVNFEGFFDVKNFEMDSILCNLTHSKFNGTFINDTITSDGIITLLNIKSDIMDLDSVTTLYSLNNNQLNSTIEAVSKDSLYVHINSDVSFTDTMNIDFNEMYLRSPHEHFYMTDTVQRIRLSDQRSFVDNIEIKNHRNKDFSFKGYGFIDSKDSMNLSLSVNNFNLKSLNRFVDTSDTLSGILSSDVVLEGEPDSLLLNCRYEFLHPGYGSRVLPDVNGYVFYKDNSITNYTWLPQLDSSVYANFIVPVNIKINEQKELQYDNLEIFYAHLGIDSLKVSIPDSPEFTDIDSEAYISAQISADGTFNNPQLHGFFELNNGKFTDQLHGIYYKDILSRIELNGNTINLDSFIIHSERGHLASHGQLSFDSSIISGKINNSLIKTEINNFHVAQHNDYNILISGNTFTESKEGHLNFGGNISILRSHFFLPALIKSDMQDKTTDNMPLLLVALHKNDTLYNKKIASAKTESTLLDSLTGLLNIKILRRTWLRSNDMNLEIRGDFDIVKDKPYFELFGEVEVLRGYYILYGRKFNIKEGTISFIGGEEPDAIIDIKADYIFRGSDKEKHILELSAGQLISEPNINFTLDDMPVTQSDAVALMVFGKTMNELDYDSQNGIMGSVSSNMMAQMLTSKLSSTLGQRFKLDMIEINSTENWHGAAFVVGKYLTDDLLVVYQRGFGEAEDDEITPETIILEYEVNDILFLRLQSGTSKTSGFDVILRFESSK